MRLFSRILLPAPLNAQQAYWSWHLVICLGSLFVTSVMVADDGAGLTPTSRLTNSESKDQDDMCVWIHPNNRSESTIIASDKSASRVFVYDLDGQVLQSISVPKPGNIDIRQSVTMDGTATDIVVVNQRTDGFKLIIFFVDPETRQLERVDDQCATAPNYGGCLFHSPKTGRLYFLCTSESGAVEQLELVRSGRRVNAKSVRTLNVGKCEGAVADDEASTLYVAEEKKGVWKFAAEPEGSAQGTLIAKVGDDALKGDVEGLALVKGTDGTGLLLVSDQGRNRFAAYQRQAPHKFAGDFSVQGATQTDGIEVCAANLGPKFPDGLFACHTDQSPRWVLLTSWSRIAPELSRHSSAK